jgi:hypothetical protein
MPIPKTYIGTGDTFTGIPTLLMPDLNQVQDQAVKTCLYQIQNYANSIGQVHGTIGTATAGFGVNNCPAIFAGSVNFWCQVSYHGQKAWIPVWV